MRDLREGNLRYHKNWSIQIRGKDLQIQKVRGFEEYKICFNNPTDDKEEPIRHFEVYFNPEELLDLLKSVKKMQVRMEKESKKKEDNENKFYHEIHKALCG